MRVPACTIVVATLVWYAVPLRSAEKERNVSVLSVQQLQVDIDRLNEQIQGLAGIAKDSNSDTVRQISEAGIRRRKEKVKILEEILDLKMLHSSSYLDDEEIQTVKAKVEELAKQYAGNIVSGREQGRGDGRLSQNQGSAKSEESAGSPHTPGAIEAFSPTTPLASPSVTGRPESTRGMPAVAQPTAVGSTPPQASSLPEAAQGDHSAPGGTLSSPSMPRGGQLVRTIVGFEQAGSAAAQSSQTYFLNLYVTTPIKFHWGPRLRDTMPRNYGEDINLGPRLRTWGDLRMTSVPQQVNASIAEFASTFAQRVGELRVNDVVQSAEFLGGIEWRLWSVRNPFRSMDSRTSERFSIGLITGGGIITPLSPRQSVRIFKVPTNQPEFAQFLQDELRVTLPQGTQYVAFTLPDRDRLFRQAYGGIRLQTHYLEHGSRPNSGDDFRPPAMLDLSWGFNESVTGGRFEKGVVRFEGFIPLPYSSANWIYLYGTALFKPIKAKTFRPFLLDAAPAGTLPTDPAAFVVTVPQVNRDYYRLGIGIDFVRLIAGWREGKNKEAANAKLRKACESETDPTKKADCLAKIDQQ